MAEVRVKLRADNESSSGVAALKRDLASIEDKNIKVTATDTGIDDAVKELANVEDKDVTITATDTGIDEAISELANVEDKDVTISATDTGIDEAISQLANVQDKSVSITATADTSQWDSFVQSLGQGISVPMMPGGGGMPGMPGLPALANPLALGGAALVGGAVYTASKAMNLDQALDFASGAGGISEGTDERERLEALVIELGKGESRFNVMQITQVAEMLFRNGVQLAGLEMGMLENAMVMSEAMATFGEDPATIAPLAADILTDAAKQFGLGPDQLGGAADLMAGFVSESKGSIQDLRYLLAQGGVAGQLGVSFEDFMTFATGAMPFFGSGGDLGTSMKSMLMQSSNLSDPQMAMWSQLGLLNNEERDEEGKLIGGTAALYDTEGKMRSLGDFFVDLKAALEPLTEAKRAEALSVMFGSDAMRAASAGAGMGGADWESMMLQLTQTSVTELAEIKSLNAAAEWEKMTGKIDTLAADIGAPLSDAILSLLQVGNEQLDYWLSDDEGKENIHRGRVMRNAEEVYRDAVESGFELQEIQKGRQTMGGGRVRQISDAEIYAAAEEKAAAFIAGDTKGGILGFGGQHLFSEEQAQEEAAALATTIRTEIEAERMELTVDVVYNVVGETPPGVGTGSTTPNRRGLQSDSTQNNSQRGETSSSGGSYDDYSQGYGGLAGAGP